MATASSSTAISRLPMSTSVRFRRGSVARRRCRTRAGSLEPTLSGPRVRLQEGVFVEGHFKTIECRRLSRARIHAVSPAVAIVGKRELVIPEHREADRRMQRDGRTVVREHLQPDPLAAERPVEPSQQGDLAEVDKSGIAAFLAPDQVVELAVGRTQAAYAGIADQVALGRVDEKQDAIWRRQDDPTDPGERSLAGRDELRQKIAHVALAPRGQLFEDVTISAQPLIEADEAADPQALGVGHGQAEALLRIGVVLIAEQQAAEIHWFLAIRRSPRRTRDRAPRPTGRDRKASSSRAGRACGPWAVWPPSPRTSASWRAARRTPARRSRSS